MASKRIVIINHWGGVPSSLHGNVLAMETWSDRTSLNIPLVYTDKRISFEESTTHMWKYLKNAGYHTVCLGATGCVDTTPRQQSTYFQDPQQCLKHCDIDRCSLHDGNCFTGPSLLHDQHVLEEAQVLLSTFNGPLAICVNLLSCRDTSVYRFCAPNAIVNTHCFTHTAQHAHPVDTRLIPLSTSVQIKGISELIHMNEGAEFGENGVPCNAITKEQYGTLLMHGWSTLKSLHTTIEPFIATALSQNANIAMTATSSLSLGEHGVRGSNSPFKTCSSTFWISTVSESILNGKFAPLEDYFRSFVSTVCMSSAPSCKQHRRELSLCKSVVGKWIFFRLVCQIHDHIYVCIGNKKEIICMFDALVDPFEIDDISQHMQHLYDRLLSLYKTSIAECVDTSTSLVVETTQGYNYVHSERIVPKQIAPEQKQEQEPESRQTLTHQHTKMDQYQVKYSPITNVVRPTHQARKRNEIDHQSTIHNTFSRQATEKQKQKVSALRAKENRLNIMHR
jgi:hypothetical protein